MPTSPVKTIVEPIIIKVGEELSQQPLLGILKSKEMGGVDGKKAWLS